jgi:hypothetical protein
LLRRGTRNAAAYDTANPLNLARFSCFSPAHDLAAGFAATWRAAIVIAAHTGGLHLLDVLHLRCRSFGDMHRPATNNRAACCNSRQFR